MWQVLLAAAAAAGSGILAKKLINPTDTEKPISEINQIEQQCEYHKKHLQREDSGGIFRFSSSETKSKEFNKKIQKNGGAKKWKKSGFIEGGDKSYLVNKVGNFSGKKVSVCLKKRRTGKHAAGKCESCASKDNSFGVGVGVGIMYMMSSGKSENSRLNSAMDNTAKTVQELKDEIFRRKSEETNKTHIGRSDYFPVSHKSKDNIKAFCPFSRQEGECCSSVLTEEHDHFEGMEMDQLEAELEFELQKLPWCVTEGSGSKGKTDVLQAQVLSKEANHSDFHQHIGVSPAELDQKLCHLLIEKQENQIMEFESELHQAQSKLQEKEAELQTLKDCVKRLTEFSLANVSDEETEGRDEDVKKSYGDVGFGLRKSTVGMKRSMGYESYICSEN